MGASVVVPFTLPSATSMAADIPLTITWRLALFALGSFILIGEAKLLPRLLCGHLVISPAG